MSVHPDDVAGAARSLLHAASDRVARQSPHAAPPTGSALARYEARATTAAELYLTVATARFVREAPACVLADLWHGARLWALLDAARFGPLAARLDELLVTEHDVGVGGLVRRNELQAVAGLVAVAVDGRRQLDTPGEVRDADEDDDDDDSQWGLSGPLDDLVDELGLAEHYPDQYGGGAMFYDENVYRVGWKGDLPANVVGFLAARGQSDWVHFHPVPYSEDELLRGASTLMDRLHTAKIACRSGGPNGDCTAAVVTFYDRPAGTRGRAEGVAAKLSDQLGLPLEVIPTTEPPMTAL